MSVLFITPDSASHYNPLVPIGHIWREKGETVYVATGTHLRRRVESDGFVHILLQLDDGGNDGLVQPDTMDANVLGEYLNLSRQGMISILKHQATDRRKHLLWSPEFVIRRIDQIAAEVLPRLIISVQLAYNATLALKALEIPFASFVTGHPMECPVESEVQGYPYYFPKCIRVDEAELRELAAACLAAQESFTQVYNEVLRSHNLNTPAEVNAFSAISSQLVIFNYPQQVLPWKRDFSPTRALYIGSAVREARADPELQAWLERRDESCPTVYVTLGSFFSLRSDILADIASVLREQKVRALFALGVAPCEAVEPLPDGWLIRRSVPQPAVLPHCDLMLFHGGNNSFTEALSCGVPMVAGPLSSDQFYCAADIERMGLGRAVDPNSVTQKSLREQVFRAMESRTRCQEIGAELQADPGPARVVECCEEMFGRS